MSRYFFHLHNDTDTQDEDGIELSSDEEAIKRAKIEARNMAIASITEHSHLVLHHKVIVTCEDGALLAEIRFGDVVEIRE